MSADQTAQQIQNLVAPLLAPLGLEPIAIEIVHTKEKKLRVFIDHTTPGLRVGIEDCVKATRAMNEILDQSPMVESAFGGGYELEVSSPGIERPLSTAAEFVRFRGERARVHTFRPLNAEEITDADYQAKNPRQKNFLGNLEGFENDRILLSIPISATKSASITIPLALVSKAHLEPDLDTQELLKKTK